MDIAVKNIIKSKRFNIGDFRWKAERRTPPRVQESGCSVRAVLIKSLARMHRVAIITLSDPADMSKALEDSRNKRIFGSLIESEKLNNHHDERYPS